MAETQDIQFKSDPFEPSSEKIDENSLAARLGRSVSSGTRTIPFDDDRDLVSEVVKSLDERLVAKAKSIEDSLSEKLSEHRDKKSLYSAATSSMTLHDMEELCESISISEEERHYVSIVIAHRKGLLKSKSGIKTPGES